MTFIVKESYKVHEELAEKLINRGYAKSLDMPEYNKMVPSGRFNKK